MHLNRDMFLLLSGTIVFLLVAAALRFLASRGQSQFREDIWGEASQKRKNAADHIHRTVDFIALEAPPEEVTEKIHLSGRNLHEDEKTDPAPKRSNSRPSAPQPYRSPNFRGQAHEVLGIARDANRETVLSAYKYWIKRYHPDRVQHLGPGYVKQANARAEQLNDAKEQLLKRLQ